MRTQLIGMISLVRKETSRVLRIWVQTLIPPGITMSLYFIIFGTLIGKRIGEMEGYPYMEYIAPGLVMMSVITNSYGNVVGSFFNCSLICLDNLKLLSRSLSCLLGQTPPRGSSLPTCHHIDWLCATNPISCGLPAFVSITPPTICKMEPSGLGKPF